MRRRNDRVGERAHQWRQSEWWGRSCDLPSSRQSTQVSNIRTCQNSEVRIPDVHKIPKSYSSEFSIHRNAIYPTFRKPEVLPNLRTLETDVQRPIQRRILPSIAVYPVRQNLICRSVSHRSLWRHWRRIDSLDVYRYTRVQAVGNTHVRDARRIFNYAIRVTRYIYQEPSRSRRCSTPRCSRISSLVSKTSMSVYDGHRRNKNSEQWHIRERSDR